jgi:molybdenum cofactor biosynthesis protein B
VSTPSVHLAVLVVATDPAKADLATAMIIRGRATNAGHQIVQQHVTKDMEAGIRSQLARWIDDRDIDVILICGAVESDAVPAAVKPLVTEHLPGFTDLFRYLAFQELGAGAMLSNAEAAQCNSTYLFVLPGSAGAVGTAMDKLILPQLDPKTKPKNLVDSIPRLKDAVPSTIITEKTSGGAGILPKLPASPATRAQPVRMKPPTGRNVVRRPEHDPPTRQVDVAKLERLANPNDAQTRPNIELRKMLPKRPPGADEEADDATDTDILAAPPPILATATEKRADTAPMIPPPPPSPVLPVAARAKTPTGQRGRPITVPPTSAFPRAGTAPGTMPPRPASGTGRQAPAVQIPKKESTEPGAVMPSRRPADSGKQAVSSGVPTTRASKKETGRIAPPPPPKDAFAPRTKTTTGAAPVVTIPAVSKSPTGSVPVTPAIASEPVPASKPDEANASVQEIEQEVAKARAPLSGATAAATSSSATPSVEMAPLLDAQELDEEPAETNVPPAKPAPRTPTPTPPPPLVVPRDSAVDLPVGTFNYPVKTHRKSKAATIIALLVAAGIGFAAVVYLVPRFTQKKAPQSAQVEQPAPPPPAAVVEQPAPTPAPEVEVDAAVAETPEPTPPEPTPTPTPATTKPVSKPTTKPTTKPTGAVTKPDTTPTPDTKPDPTPPPAQDGCDEVGCVLSKYDRPCCERYKPQSTDLKPRSGGIPEELDRAMVRSGVEKVKPAVVQCGEKAAAKGTVKIAVEVAPEGNVKSAEVTESPDTALGACVATALKKAQFGKSVNGGSFTYPFVF